MYYIIIDDSLNSHMGMSKKVIGSYHPHPGPGWGWGCHGQAAGLIYIIGPSIILLQVHGDSRGFVAF